MDIGPPATVNTIFLPSANLSDHRNMPKRSNETKLILVTGATGN